MARPVYSWPKVATLPAPAVESSSKLKRSALNFLSTIRIGEEDMKIPPRSTSLLSPIVESSKEKAILPMLPGHPDSGWGAGMRGDVNAKYITVSQVKTDRPHRLFLSWGRAYPVLVTSLVLNEKPSSKPTKSAARSTTLDLPADESRRHDESLDGEETLANRDDRFDYSSSDEEAIVEKGRHGRSFEFMLKSSRLSNRPGSPQSPRIIVQNPDDPSMAVQSPFASGRRRKIIMVGNDDDQDREKGETAANLAWDNEYSQELLDDSKIIQGKHRVVQNLPSARISIIPYIKTKVLKDELNSVFREQHPNLPQDLTLSMLRKLRKELLERAKSANLELCTVALAYVYLEKLVLKGVVHKANRKVVAFSCLVIAFKFNEYGADKLKLLLQEIDKVNGISSQEIFKTEFAVFAHLRFNLMIPGKDYFEHFVRLLRTVDVAPSEYLGETHDDVTQTLKSLASQSRIKEDDDGTKQDDDDRSSKSSDTTKKDHDMKSLET